MRGLRKFLTPFAPDQSGAVSVFYEFGGIIVICDAGGCTGNICGFDEPRWFERKSALFSAGLRDMDAILGRDDRLVEKLADVAAKLPVSFAAIIGTPVPAVIGTDYHALKRMTEKKVDLPILTVDTDGMELYDKGAEKAWLELFHTFSPKGVCSTEPGRIGILGMTPHDVSDLRAGERIRARFAAEGRRVVCYGMGDGLEAVRMAGAAERNIVVSPAALEAAKLLKRMYGTPYETGYPLADELVKPMDYSKKRVLIVQQQVIANAIREEILRQSPEAEVTVASWFMMKPELRWEENPEPKRTGSDVQSVRFASENNEIAFTSDSENNEIVYDSASENSEMASGSDPENNEMPCRTMQTKDCHLRDEEDYIRLVKEGGFDVIYADACMKRMTPEFAGIFVDTLHFAVSGRLQQ